MSTAEARPPRRVRVERNIYRRPDGRLEVGYRDSASKQRWKGPLDTITAARRARDALLGAKARGERVEPNPRLTFGTTADKWLAEQVVELRPATRAIYANAVNTHLRPRWGGRRLDQLRVDDAARLVRDLRASGLAEWTISGIVKAANRVFKFAARRLGWYGVSPFTLLENGERPRVSETAERRAFLGVRLGQ